MKNKRFISIATEIINNKLIYINTSTGESLTDAAGISSFELIEFMHDLVLTHKTHKKNAVIFVCYAFTKDVEFMFRDLPTNLKDELFQNHVVKKEIAAIEEHKQDLLELQYNKETELSETETVTLYNQIADVRRVLGLAGKITYKNYSITLMQGKQLMIKKDNVSFVLYDIFGFFRKALSIAVSDHLQISSIWLTEEKSNELETRKQQSTLDCFYIAKLAEYIYIEFAKRGIHISRFHGSSVITSAILSKSKARDEYRNFKNNRSLPPELKKAVNQSFYGARVEQLKLGSFNNINVYDLNSAYAKAVTYLPQMLQKPCFTKDWKAEPFSVWHIDYELPKNIYYGLLPNRDTNFITKYKRRGSGYYWQPEIIYLMQNFPDCIKINRGFYVPYKQAHFTRSISELYELRRTLKRDNNPLEKVIKLALATIYGKFCQRIGFAYYYNLFYAGFVTSYVRANLLQATHGVENKTICFLTDAIHTTAKLNVSVSDNLGDFSHEQYDNGAYLGAGIYKLDNYTTKETKKAMRGFTYLDYEQAFKDLKDTGTFTAFQDYFCGHNLHSLSPIEFNQYLQPQRKALKVSPFDSKARLYDAMKADLKNDSIDSILFDSYSGRESSEYAPNERNDFNFMFDAVLAGKK